jgi:hypothetical protein
VLEKVALGQVFIRVALFFSVSIIPPLLHNDISSGGMNDNGGRISGT